MSSCSGLTGQALMPVHSDRRLVEDIMVIATYVTVSYQEAIKEGAGGGAACIHVRSYLAPNGVRQGRL
jgi:hypothetical protein